MPEVIQILIGKSKLTCLVLFVLLISSANLNAQTDKKYVRKGNREYDKSKYSDSEISYRKAIDQNKQYPDAVFNVGDALYRQNKFEEAGKQFAESSDQNVDKVKKSAGLYNMGNALLKANKLQESIEAYKNSLKLRPNSKEAKYNLAYAQDLLKRQQEQQKNQKDQDNKDQNQDKNKQDKNKDQQKDQKDKNKDQQKDQNKNQDQKQQEKPQNGEISKEDAQRLLNSLANDEKNVQEKVKLAKAQKEKIRTVKNW
jgi:Ca-activated chloride channel family protein